MSRTCGERPEAGPPLPLDIYRPPPQPAYPCSVRELLPKPAKTGQSRSSVFYCFVGLDWLLLSGVAGEIRLRTRRPGVRISQGAPFSPHAGLRSLDAGNSR